MHTLTTTLRVKVGLLVTKALGRLLLTRSAIMGSSTQRTGHAVTRHVVFVAEKAVVKGQGDRINAALRISKRHAGRLLRRV